MTEPLTTGRAEAYVEASKNQNQGPIAFVGVTPQEEDRLGGIYGALGIAIANELGYMPVPIGWARYSSLDAARDHADKLNKHIGLSDDEATRIIFSTMGGRRYTVLASDAGKVHEPECADLRGALNGGENTDMFGETGAANDFDPRDERINALTAELADEKRMRQEEKAKILRQREQLVSMDKANRKHLSMARGLQRRVASLEAAEADNARLRVALTGIKRSAAYRMQDDRKD